MFDFLTKGGPIIWNKFQTNLYNFVLSVSLWNEIENASLKLVVMIKEYNLHTNIVN